MAVQFKFTGDDKDVQRALERMEKKYNDLINATKKGTDETKKMADAAKKAFDDTRTPMERYQRKLDELNALLKQGAINQDTFARASAKAGQELEKASSHGEGIVASGLKAAAAYLSVQRALQLVNNEIRNKIELDRKSADAVRSQAKIREDISLNLGASTPAEIADIRAGATKISRARNVPQSQIEAAIPGLTSSKGNLTNAQMMSNLDIAAAAAPNNPETMAALALGLNNTARLTGSTSAVENFGFQLGLGQSAQVASLADINEYLIRGAVGVKGFGATAAEAGSLVSTLSTGMGDTSGRMSGTAGISLAEQLAKAFPEKDTYKYDEHGRKKIDKRGTGFTSPDQIIHYLQQNPAARDRFMSEASFEHAAYIPVRDILTAGTGLASTYEERKGEMAGGAAAQARAAQYFEQQKKDPLLNAAALDRSYKSTTERFLLDNLVEAQRSSSREGVGAVLQASGQSAIQTMIDQVAFEANTWAGADPQQEATRIFSQRRRTLLGLGRFGIGSEDEIAAEEATARGNVSPERAAKADLLKIQLDQLEELKKINRDQRSRDPSRGRE